MTACTHRQTMAVRSIIKDAVRSGVEPDEKDIDELRRLRIPTATIGKVVDLANVGVAKFESGDTMSLNEANRFADHYAETLTDQLAEQQNARTTIDDTDRKRADEMWRRQQAGIRVDTRRSEARPAKAINRAA